KAEDYPEKIQRFCLVHTATGLTLNDLVREGLPTDEGDLVPVTLEEEIVTYADKFHTKHPAFDSYETIKKRIAKYDPSRAVRLDNFRMKFGIPDTTELAKKYKQWSADIDDKISSISNS